MPVAHSAPQSLCACAETAPRHLSFRPLRRFPRRALRRFPRRALRRGRRRRPGGPARRPARQSASFRAWHFQLRRRSLPHSGRPYPARHFSATRLIRCRTRLPLPHPTFPFAPDYTLPNAAFFATPLNCRPLRPLSRTRDFPLRTPWPTVPAMPDDAPPSPNARQLCPAPLFCRLSLHSEVSLN